MTKVAKIDEIGKNDKMTKIDKNDKTSKMKGQKQW